MQREIDHSLSESLYLHPLGDIDFLLLCKKYKYIRAGIEVRPYENVWMLGNKFTKKQLAFKKVNFSRTADDFRLINNCFF